jgi:hypothetical protein
MVEPYLSSVYEGDLTIHLPLPPKLPAAFQVQIPVLLIFRDFEILHVLWRSHSRMTIALFPMRYDDYDMLMIICMI